MSGRLLMCLGLHPDALIIDEPTCEFLGASLVQIGIASGATLSTGREISPGATHRTHKLIRKRGKLLRVPLKQRRDGDWDGKTAERVLALLATEPLGLSVVDIAKRMGWSRTGGKLYRMINRMVVAGKISKRRFKTTRHGGDVRFFLVTNATVTG